MVWARQQPDACRFSWNKWLVFFHLLRNTSLRPADVHCESRSWAVSSPQFYECMYVCWSHLLRHLGIKPKKKRKGTVCACMLSVTVDRMGKGRAGCGCDCDCCSGKKSVQRRLGMGLNCSDGREPKSCQAVGWRELDSRDRGK